MGKEQNANEVLNKAAKKLEKIFQYINSHPMEYKKYHDLEKPSLADIIINEEDANTAHVIEDKNKKGKLLVFFLPNKGTSILAAFSGAPPMLVSTSLDSKELKLEFKEPTSQIHAYFYPTILYEKDSKKLKNQCDSQVKQYKKERNNANNFLTEAKEKLKDSNTNQEERKNAKETISKCTNYVANFNVSEYKIKPLTVKNTFNKKEETIYLGIPKIV